MIGLGILIRILRRILGKPLENSGALPTRYYLHEILDSLDQDNIGQGTIWTGLRLSSKRFRRRGLNNKGTKNKNYDLTGSFHFGT